MTRTLGITLAVVFVGTVFAGSPAPVASWDFDAASDLRQWVPNTHLTNVVISDGVLRADAVDWDPFILCRGIEIPAVPWQYVAIRLRASKPGIGELFWSGELEGQYGGLTESKKVRFSVTGGEAWQDIVLFPFWHTEHVVRQLRLDVYEGAHFDVDWIRVHPWGEGQAPTQVYSWGTDEIGRWRIHPEACELFAPPVRIDVSDKAWITAELASDQEDTAAILWAQSAARGLQSEDFPLKGDGQMHTYNLHMAANPAWRGEIVAFGIRLPPTASMKIHSIHLSDEPSGPGELEVRYFGFENGVNRSGRPCRLLAQVANRGGAVQGIRRVHLDLPMGLKLVAEPDRLWHEGIAHDETACFTWDVLAEKPGRFPVRLSFSGKGRLPADQEVWLEFTEPPSVVPAEYVPVPRPIDTRLDVCAFYFPGWETDRKWDCVRRVARNRKPLLGYYDESNPECVDWQIKWAVENGISCFLVDWYWVQGRQQLTHWFEAYRKARYRDFLKVAIMWANHNPPNTHSMEDWLNVTGEWIERYFTLKAYYHIDDRPAVFIWNPAGIRHDLGGSGPVKRALDASQAMARAAGFRGITFVAMNTGFEAGHMRTLLDEGYKAVTTYHEWGVTIDGGVSRKRFHYDDVVRHSPAAWRRKHQAAGPLDYYPLVDTGWDSRPWHGDKAMVIGGRTPEAFERLLREAKSFCEETSKSILILGPVNEWGEGSYIEPCTEFGFGMVEAVRRTFGLGEPQDWPANVAPADVGLGPYDFIPGAIEPAAHPSP